MDQEQLAPSTNDPGGRRTLRLILIGFVSTIIVGDQLIALMSFPRLVGSSNPIRWKLEMYQDAQRPVDVIYTGCSHEECGISPAVVDKRASEILGQPVSSFNMAASCASVMSSSLLVRRVIEMPDPPKVVYLGVSWRSVDAGYENWQEFGLRALSTPRDWTFTWRCKPDLFVESVLAGTFNSYYLWREYRLATQRLVKGAPLLSGIHWHYNPAPDLGWSRAPKSQELLRVIPSYADSMENILSYQAGIFEPGNPNDAALRAVITELQQRGITPKLLEMPLVSAMDQIRRPDVMKRYQEFLDRLMEDTGVELVRPPAGVVSDEDFYDFVHMYPRGAKRFSHWFAEEVATTLARKRGLSLERDGSTLALSEQEARGTSAQ